MMAKTKRAPGGGRKRLGPSVARNLTIRIDDELRERLEIKAGKRARRKRNWNLSQEILMRLWQSLEREREREDDSDTAILAICYLISEKLAKIIYRKNPNWHRDPFWFRTFRLAVSNFLSRIEPPGEIVTPASMLERPAKTPEAIAEFMSDLVLDELKLSKPMTSTEKAIALERHAGDEDFVSEIQGELYDIERARRD